MTQAKGLYPLIAFLGLLNAVAFTGAAALTGFSALPLILGAAVWLIIAVGLKARLRTMAYLSFMVAIVSALVAYAQMTPERWVLIAILILSAVLAVLLFITIWRRPLTTS